MLLSNFLQAVGIVIEAVLSIYFWIVIISALLSWVNPDPYNPIVRTLRNLTEPVFMRLRRLMPFLVVGGLDLTPLVVLLSIQFLKIFIVQSIFQLALSVR